ncbi:GLE1-like protein-domain-containing protein [Mortierella sp. GBAus27b]|nr:GLE1-like protein-domain-containing protein [Mortierella sp. GBAus27b]
MAATNLPLEFVLRRSLAQGIIDENDPELAQLRSSQRASTVVKNRDRTESRHNGALTTHAPLSPLPEIRFHQRDMVSNTHQSPAPAPRMNLINSRRARKSGAALSGYGLDDFSSSDDDDSHDSSESEDDDPESRKSDAANYITHLTSRLDPWEWKIRKVQEETKIAPRIAQKIEQDLKSFEMRPATTPNWIRNLDDVHQRVRSMSLETEAIKEARRKEFEARQSAMDKQVDDCFKRIKDERETAIRIREEALKQIQLEKENAAKAEEEKAKAETAKKQAQERKAAEDAAAAERAIKDAKDKRAAEAAEKAKNAVQDASNASAIFVSESASVEYRRYMELIQHIKTVVRPAIDNDPGLKKFCNGIKREVLPFIGQLTNERKTVFRVAEDIDRLFKTAMQTQNENIYYWALNIAAKKMAKQTEGEALVKSAPAFPVAHVCVLLFTNHPKFQEVLLARIAKKCPYAVPIYMSKEASETPDEYLRRLRYRRKEKGLENETEYNSRQCAIFTLYCAIMQSNTPGVQNLYPLSHGWTWMSRILNMPPRPITPSLITVFLEVCGDKYLRIYGAQARKVIQLLMNDFIPLIPQQGISGTSRLKTLLEDYLRTGQLPPPNGREFDS